MVFGTTQRRRLLLPCMVLGLLLVILSQRRLMHRKLRHKAKLLAIQSVRTVPDKALVLGKRRRESIHWALDLYPSWHPYIYSICDPPESGYPILKTLHGLDTILFLTFIIDNYESLPNYTAFISTDAENSNLPKQTYLTSYLLKSLQLDTIKTQDFANIDCNDSACSSSPRTGILTRSTAEPDAELQSLSPIYAELFNIKEHDTPRVIAPANLQFVVTRDRIRARPREEYRRMRDLAVQWHESGSVPVEVAFQRLWHVIFGMPAVHCPAFDVCQCQLYDECENEDERMRRHYVPLVRGLHPQFGRWLGRWVGG